MPLFIPRLRIYFEMPDRQAQPHGPISGLSRSCVVMLWMSSTVTRVLNVDQLTCGKACRGLLETGEYWQRIYPESAVYSHSR